jgi:yecA family protein
MTSQSKRYLLARPGLADFKPPDVPALGAVTFGDSERARLVSWLGDAAWPRAHMDMAELEGYLVALISWPVGIPSGAWLPPIWGVRGWKMPKTIASEKSLDEFARLIVGFMQNLERDISRETSTFDSSVLLSLRGRAQSEAVHHWGRGFMTALTLGSQGLKWRSDNAVAAVHAIAGGTASASARRSNGPAIITSAVLSLMRERKSRGPLGPLEAAAR